jgi:hypothetical protein
VTNIEEDETCYCCAEPSKEGRMTCGKQECIRQFVLEIVKPDLEN